MCKAALCFWAKTEGQARKQTGSHTPAMLSLLLKEKYPKELCAKLRFASGAETKG